MMTMKFSFRVLQFLLLLLLMELTHSSTGIQSISSRLGYNQSPSLSREATLALRMVLQDYHYNEEIKGSASLYSQVSSPIIVGIAGGSGGGKTTLVRAIVEQLGSEHIECISHDSYYKDLNHLSVEERALTNFDHPSSLDSSLLREHLQHLKAGKSVEIPSYDFTTHSRRTERALVTPKRIILVDGILIFSDPNLCDIFDMKIFVDCEDDIRLLRRIRRDTTERARSVESVISQYEMSVRPMYLQFVEPTRRLADVIIPAGAGIPRAALEMCTSYLKEHMRWEREHFLV